MIIIEVVLNSFNRMSAAKKAVITLKVGSNVITNSQGFPDEQVIASISQQIKALRQKGHAVILVSSGAVAAGRSLYQFPRKTDTVVQRQVLSSLGQVKLISLYKQAFENSREMFSPDGLVSREGYTSMMEVLKTLDPELANADVAYEKTFNDRFVKAA